MITKDSLAKSAAEYVQKGGPFCPYCRCLNIEGDSVEIDSHEAIQTIRCLDCGREWSDVYTLSHILDEDGYRL